MLFRKKINKADHQGRSQAERTEERHRHDRNTHLVQINRVRNEEETPIELDFKQFKELFRQNTEDSSGGTEGDMQNRGVV